MGHKTRKNKVTPKLVLKAKGGKATTRKNKELTFPPEIYMGLVLPTETNPIEKTVKKVVVKAKLTNEEMEKKEGAYFDEDAADKIYDEDVDVYAEDLSGGQILIAKLRKNVISPELIKTGWEGFWTSA